MKLTLMSVTKFKLINTFQSSSFFSGQNYAFACDGRTFGLIRTHDQTLLNAIVQKGKIFARMLPEQKIHLIECMKDLG